MRRRIAVFLALLLFVLCLAAYSSAVPLLVELKIKDTTGSLNNANSGGDDALNSPGSSGGNGKSNEKKNAGGNGGGNSGGSDGAADLSSLTLWLSSDGKAWQKVSSDLLSYSSDKITAQLNGKGKGSAGDLFGSPVQDITGELSQTYYVGLSTSSSSFSATSGLSARLVSWQYVTNSSVGIPEPAILPLFAVGTLVLGAGFGSRRKS